MQLRSPTAYSRGILALPPSPPPPPPILADCPAEARQLHRHAKCGYVRVPLDRAKPDGKTIKVYFERYPRRHRELPRVSTVVSIEGGPGYPVTPDRSTRVDLWRPVSGKRDLVLIDLRGTGRSAPLGCEAFSRKSRGYVARAGRCAALTAADVIARWMVNYDGTSVGLRGGRWWYSGYPNVRFRLTNVRFVPGVAVTGSVRWAYFGGDSSASLEVRGPDGVTGELRIAWQKRPQATATLEGAIGGRRLRATMPAP
jgi:hypothetical protein